MAELPPAYYADVELMERTAAAWARAHPFAEPRFSLKPFEDEVKRRAGRPLHENVMIGAPLRAVIDKIGANEDARAMLRALVDATDGRASYFQFACIYRMKIEAHVKRGQGQNTAPGDWRCPCCAKMLDGYSRTDGQAGALEAGMLSICAYCGAVSTVNDACNGFVAMPDSEQRALPADVRRQIHDLRNAMQQRIAQEAKRS